MRFKDVEHAYQLLREMTNLKGILNNTEGKVINFNTNAWASSARHLFDDDEIEARARLIVKTRVLEIQRELSKMNVDED